MPDCRQFSCRTIVHCIRNVYQKNIPKCNLFEFVQSIMIIMTYSGSRSVLTFAISALVQDITCSRSIGKKGM